MHPADDNALNTEEKIWDLTMDINLKGVWWGCKHAILAMRNNTTDEAKGLHTGGSIINTASFVAIMGAATPQLACGYFLHGLIRSSPINKLLSFFRHRLQGNFCDISTSCYSRTANAFSGRRPCDDT